MGSVAPNIAELDGSNFNITRSTNLRDVPLPGSPEELSHSHCTDHMVTVRWTAQQGWETPEVKPYQNLSIPPTASVLHYATECFEGMKVYRGYDGKLRLFRPDCNGERLNSSSQRSSLPGFKYDELKKLVAKLLQIDGARESNHQIPTLNFIEPFINLLRLAPNPGLFSLHPPNGHR